MRQRKQVPTLANSLLQPFYRLLVTYELPDSIELEKLPVLRLDARRPWDETVAQLLTAVELTGDADLGLKAGRLFDLADGGVLAYAASSAQTLRDAMAITSRYLGLLSDVSRYRLVVEGARAYVHLDSADILPRAAADFQASVLRTHHRRTHSIDIPNLEWSFRHERPADMQEYERTFGATHLSFAAPYFGFCFDARLLDIPLRTADARLHQGAMAQIEAGRTQIPQVETMVTVVRRAIMRDPSSNTLSARQLSRQLGMSTRTLARRLEEEGTSFRALVDDARRGMAKQYLAEQHRTVAQVGLLLGYAEVATFYRAFRRWYQMTPLEYRRSLDRDEGDVSDSARQADVSPTAERY